MRDVRVFVHTEIASDDLQGSLGGSGCGGDW